MHVTRAELWPYVRTAVEGGYHYESIGPDHMFTNFPPAVGDLLSLPDDPRVFRVIDRHWEHARIGSSRWRADGDEQRTLLKLVLEEATGMFVDEVPTDDA